MIKGVYKLLNITKIDLGTINLLSRNDVRSLVLDAETLYKNNILEVARFIKENDKKIILISGPSSAGKTTTSYNLRKALNGVNISSHVLNMDDFYKNPKDIPLRADGERDIESVRALDVECIKNCLNDILTKGETLTPRFDFVELKRKDEWIKCQLKDNEIIIMEGIHALNPQIISGLDKSKIVKIYLDCQTSFYYKDELVLNNRNLRFLRRIIRDERDRNVPIKKTMQLWESVCAGEDENIKPFMVNADIIINTVFKYEPLLYKTLLENEFKEFKDDKIIENFLKVFNLCETISPDLIPNDSLIREFIGY